MMSGAAAFELMGAMVCATFLGMCIYALVRARRALAEGLRVRAQVDSVAKTSIRDAPNEGRVHLTGRATGSGGVTVTAPFTGEPVLWVCSAVRTNIGQVIDSWTRHVDEIVLDDGSGRVANVRLAGATVRVGGASVHGSEHQRRIAEFMESIQRSPGSGEFHDEQVIRAGDTVNVLATATPAAAYRENAGAIALNSEAGDVLLYDLDVEAGEPAKRRRHIGCAIYGIVFFALATATLLTLVLRD